MIEYIDYCPSSPVSIDAEVITVPSGSPYVVETKHDWIVNDSSIAIWENNDKSGTHLVEEAYTGTVSESGKYQVDYLGASEGDAKYCNKIFFHANQAGLSFYVWYKTEGDVFGANDANSKALKDPGAVENNLAKFDSSGNPVDSGIASNTVPKATTANLTFYVNPSTGSDENPGTSGSPFKTIAKAISLIPKIVNHNVTINLANGSYSEGITLTGYMGGGTITIVGNTTNPENVVFSEQIIIVYSSIFHEIKGLETTYTGGDGFYCFYVYGVARFEKVICDTTSGDYNGLNAQFSPVVIVTSSTFSNRKYGIYGNNCSHIYSATNSGSGNDVGLMVFGSVIMKASTQPSGTTAESARNGGAIR